MAKLTRTYQLSGGPEPDPEPLQALELPHDIAERLDKYASELGKEYLFPVSRQQAFERFARTFLVKIEAPNG